jgi:hypothetical protein
VRIQRHHVRGEDPGDAGGGWHVVRPIQRVRLFGGLERNAA